MYNMRIIKRRHRSCEKLGPKKINIKNTHTGQCVFLLFTVDFCNQFANERCKVLVSATQLHFQLKL